MTHYQSSDIGHLWHCSVCQEGYTEKDTARYCCHKVKEEEGAQYEDTNSN